MSVVSDQTPSKSSERVEKQALLSFNVTGQLRCGPGACRWPASQRGSEPVLEYWILHFAGEAIRDGTNLPAGMMVEVRTGSGNVVCELADQLRESEDEMFRQSVFAARTAPAHAIEQFAATTPLRLISGHLQGCFDLRSPSQTQ